GEQRAQDGQRGREEGVVPHRDLLARPALARYTGTQRGTTFCGAGKVGGPEVTVLTRRQLVAGALFSVPLLRAGADPCAATAPNPLGPYYRRGAPERAWLCDPAEPGEPFTLAGRVLSAGGCTPLAGAIVEAWQADAEGDYDHDDPGFRLRARLQAGGDGRYAFDTIVPGNY